MSRFLPPRLLALALATAAGDALHAQPSGGPCGPLTQHYAVPAEAAHVYYVAPDGRPEATGTTLAAPTTLAAVLPRVVTGDAVVLRGGTYRTGNLQFNQGITLQPHADERPILKGTQIATDWEPLRDGIWRTTWAHLFPARPAEWWRREREAMRTPLHRFNNDLVFVDGRPLRSAGWEGELDADSFFINYDTGHVFVRFDPRERLMEITAFDNALTRPLGSVHGKPSDGRGPTIRGLTFTQYAYRALEIEGREPEGPAAPGTYGRDVVGTTLEHVTISHCSRVAGYFRGDGFTLRHCLITDTSTEGIYVIASSDCLLEKNIFARNNVEQITGYYPAAVKIFNQSHRVVCRDNLVLDQPESNGIWYDVGNRDGVFVNNWVQGCEDGFFFEISTGALCAGNVFVNCHKGVRSLNSARVAVHHNTFINTVAAFERTTRSAVADHFGWHPATGPGVDEREGHAFTHNLLVADATFDRELLRFEQPAALRARLTRPQVTDLDHNVFVRLGPAAGRPLIVWSPGATADPLAAFPTLAAFQQAEPRFLAHAREFADYHGPLFRSLALGRYELLAAFPGAKLATAAPAAVLRALGWPENTPGFPGAYTPAP